MTGRIPNALRTCIEARILPRHDGFDAAHRRDHAETVIRRSLETAAARARQSLEIVATCGRWSFTIPATRVRRMTLQRTPAAPTKALITAEFPIFK